MRCLLPLLLLASIVPATAGENLLNNPEFTTATQGLPAGWFSEISAREGARGSFQAANGSLQIIHESENQAWVRASQQELPALPGHIYRVRCRARGDAPASIYLYEFREGETTPHLHAHSFGVPGTEWQDAAITFRAGAGAQRFKLSLVAEGKGTAWFTGVSLEDLNEAPVAVAPFAPRTVNLDSFFVLGSEGEESPQPTRVRLSYDKTALHLSFECSEPQIDKLVAVRQKDEKVYLDDCVEVFLEPPDWQGGNCQIVVNPRGAVWRGRTAGVGLFTQWYAPAAAPTGEWQPALNASGKVEKDRWTAELSIPWKDLGITPRPGMELGANFCRHRLAGGEENSCWALMRGASFLDPTQWGRLILGGDGSGSGLRPVREKPRLEPLPEINAFRTPKPVFATRAFHCQAPVRDEVESFRQLARTLAKLRFNTIILEVNDKLRYEKHPEIAASNALSKAEMRDLARFCRDLGFEVIPQVQTFGHFGYVLKHSRFRSLAENPAPTPGFGLWSYCPSNPATYDLVFDLFSEVLEVFQSRRLHIGHDEITYVPLGVCPRCKGTPAADLFARDVIKLHDWLAARGVGTIMWADQLLTTQNGNQPYNTADALPKLPRDIVLYDWHYRADPEFPSARLLRQAGFPVVVCGWFKPLNIQNFARSGQAAGAEGYCCSTWYPTGKLAQTAEAMGAMILSAQYAWDPHAADLSEISWRPTQLFRRMHEPERFAQRLQRQYAAVDISPWARLNRKETPFAKAPRGCRWMQGIPFALEDKLITATAETPKVRQVGVGTKLTALHFLHATTRPARMVDHLYDDNHVLPGTVGYYLVTYADGATVKIPLTYRENITDWNSKQGAGQCDLAWQGHRGDGALATLCAYEWQNPRPDEPVLAVDLVRTGKDVDIYLVALTAALGK